MFFLKINKCLYTLKIFIFILISYNSFSADYKDCNHDAFYIKNVQSDVTSDNLINSKSLAENNAKSEAFKRLLKRLAFKVQIKTISKINVKTLIDFIKINQESNSTKRFLGSFDICFNRTKTINFFVKNKISYAEVFSLPISVLPIFGSPRGYVFFDENDLWNKFWSSTINKYEGLLKLKFSKGNLFLKRNIDVKHLLKSDSKEILKILNHDNSKRLLIVLAEPLLLTNGNFALSTYAKLYDEKGKFVSNIYKNTKNFKSYGKVINLQEKHIKKEINKIISIFSNSWKKNNLFKGDIINQVNFYIPIENKEDWSHFILMIEKIPYIDEFKIVAIKKDVGKVSINFNGTLNTLFNILNEKGLMFEQINDEFVLLK